MELPRTKVVLWTGPKHSGKSTAARRLIDQAAAERFSVAGILAPARYEDGVLAGFDVMNITTGLRRSLARRTEKRSQDRHAGRFAFCRKGLRIGNAALRSPQARVADLVIVDEFGPMELHGRGWRHAVDQLIASFPGTLLLVVRNELADAVARVYTEWVPERIPAAEDHAARRLLRILHLKASALSGLRTGVGWLL